MANADVELELRWIFAAGNLCPVYHFFRKTLVIEGAQGPIPAVAVPQVPIWFRGVTGLGVGWGPRVAVTTAGVVVVKPAEGRAVVIADNPTDVLTAGIANFEVRTVTNFPEWMVKRKACIH